MPSAPSNFLEEHKDFVLKLKLKLHDGTSQIRRVRLPRIPDGEGSVSYEELENLVVTFTFPEGGTPQDYTVALTYYDVDSDAVTIASTDELVDAIEQFAGKNLLRITTEVKPKRTADEAVPPPPRTERGTAPVQPPVQKVLESFVGVLATAVSGLQEGLAVAQERSAAKRTAPEVPSGSETFAAKPTDQTTDNSDTDNKSSDKPVEETAPAPAEEKEASEPTKKEDTNKEERPFIHGRHTCDSCLTTPIVGKRYNAKNVDDYDLCENCYNNYTGTEMTFEPVELDRDRPFQDRWARRREKLKYWKNRQCPGGRFGRHGGRRQWGPRGRRHEPFHTGPKPTQGHPPPPAPSCPPGPHGGPPPSPFGPPPHHPPHPFWAHLGPNVGPHMAPHLRGCAPNEFDSALKEAIRRSLSDVTAAGSKEASNPEKEAEQTSDNGSAKKEAARAPKVDEDEVVIKAEIPETQAPNEIPNPVVDLEEPSQGTSSSQDHAKALETATVAVDVTPKAEHELSETAKKELEESMLETESVDSEKMVAESDDQEKKPAAVERSSSEPSKKSEADESFASDAIGIGDVAEAVGTTLDIVAGVISEMLSDTNDEESPKPKSNEQKKAVPREEESLPSGTSGALILDSAEEVATREGSSPSEENGWHVVNAEDGVTNNDEAIARAAEMLGSALFNSDMRSSEENVSALSSSDSFSLGTSVPSTVPSLAPIANVAAPQRLIWASHLEKLKELGFDDEQLCIEVLERLRAANIGVGSEDEISITQAVNAILERQA